MSRAFLTYSRPMRYQSPSPQESTTVTCPKCAYEQEEGAECSRCGIIFAKFKPATQSAESTKAPRPDSDRQPVRRGVWSRLFRILPWISLLLTVSVVLTILRPSPPLQIQIDPQAADRLAGKMARTAMAVRMGRSHVLTLDEAELNQWMRENLMIAAASQERQSILKDVRLNLLDSQLRAYVLVMLYGKDISLRLDGALETREGFIRLKPTTGQIGSLPLPSTALDLLVRQLFETPQNQAMFKLPPQIESIGIERRELVIVVR